MSNPSDTRQTAFTLIELLVVIAIISVLAAILFPVFAQARESARQAACASNMHQLGLAMRMYISDYDETWFPGACSNPIGSSFSTIQPWIGYDNNNVPNGDMELPAVNPIRLGFLDPYINNNAVKRCPDAPTGWQMALALNAFGSVYPSDYYAVNPAAMGNEFGPSFGASGMDPATGQLIGTGATDAVIDEPSTTLILWEHGFNVPLCNFLQAPNWLTSPPGGAYEAHFHLLHRSGSTTLWADGHVKHIIYGQLRRPWFSCRKDIYPPGSW